MGVLNPGDSKSPTYKRQSGADPASGRRAGGRPGLGSLGRSVVADETRRESRVGTGGRPVEVINYYLVEVFLFSLILPGK